MLKLIAAVLFSLSFAGFAQEPVPAEAAAEATAAAPESKEKVGKPAKASTSAKVRKPRVKKPLTPKQQAQRVKMKACNQSAKVQDLHGDPRKAFMKDCLKKD